MDIAKYMVTALLLSTIFAEMNEPIILYVVIVLTPIVLGLGLYWINEGRKKKGLKIRNDEYINSCRVNIVDSDCGYNLLQVPGS